MMNLGEIFSGTSQAQETTTPTGTQAARGGPLGMFVPMIFVFAIFYLLMIRPQQKQKRQHQGLLSALKKGDEVVTSAGIHGKVFGVADQIVTLEIADNVRVKLDKQQVATIKQSVAA